MDNRNCSLTHTQKKEIIKELQQERIKKNKK